MNPIKFFTTPEYLFRPRQALIRLKRAVAKPRGVMEWVTLPWGARIQIRPAEVIGANIWYYGIFDLIVAEAIARLTDPGDTALDIGANIGQMTTLLCLQVGARGRVDAFEPHPEIFSELERNLAPWAGHGPCGAARLHQVALSNSKGEGHLTLAPYWNGNRGTGRIATATRQPEDLRLPITLETLEAIIGPASSIGVCKIDVEGHERQVFQGAARLLQRRAIRDIVFEDLAAFPSPVHQILLDHGYHLFALWSRVMRPVLQPIHQSASIPTTRDGMNYLATLEPDRAQARFRSGGWWALKRCPRTMGSWSNTSR